MLNIGRYYRTLKYLRLSQLSGQVMTRLRKVWRDPAKILAPEPANWGLGGGVEKLLLADPVSPQDANDLEKGRFCFINQTADLGQPVAWDAPGMPRLWSYNLHYFDWLWSLLDDDSQLVACKWEGAKRLTVDWIENHQPSKTAGGWEPYPVSLRLMNWGLLYGVRHRDRVAEDEDFRGLLLSSIARQVCWLELNLETHIQANHLLENLAALVCVGSVLVGAESERVLSRYLPMLEAELEEQILADGMHYERSPMYHLRMLWLVEMLSAVGVEDLEELVARMKFALVSLRHPDGGIALLNDSVQGVYNDSLGGEVLVNGAWSLPDAGYYGYRSDCGSYLIVDAGAVGPDYQPGHAHADYLSFELSLNGCRLITDTGIGTYDTGARRSYDRSTAAHSTVEVSGENSAEVWGGFRVGRRVTPKVSYSAFDDGMRLEAEHDGYSWLPNQVIHKRGFEWCDGGLTVIDTIVAKRDGAKVISRLHFAPGCELEIDGDSVNIQNGENLYVCKIDGDCEINIEIQPSCLRFGVSVDRKVLTMKYSAPKGECQRQFRIQSAKS